MATSQARSGIGRLGRRLVTIPSVFLCALASVLLAPLWIPALGVADLVRRRRMASLRLGAFVTWYLHCEAAGLSAAFALWLLDGPWRGGRRERYLERNFRLQLWWAATVLRGSQGIFGTDIEVEGAEHAEATPLLLLPRHASLGDTMLPSVVVAAPFGTRLRYVLKRELLWDPCLDVVGHRLRNYFVDRGSEESEREVQAVGELGEGLGPGEGVLIYPEGTRFTQAKRERVLAALRQRERHELARRAEGLAHVLPPRTGGLFALMDRCPDADAVFCAHTGFEGAGTLRELWNGGLIGRHIRVALWRVPAAEIPHIREERVEWLLTQWERVDAWIARARAADPPPVPVE